MGGGGVPAWGGGAAAIVDKLKKVRFCVFVEGVELVCDVSSSHILSENPRQRQRRGEVTEYLQPPRQPACGHAEAGAQPAAHRLLLHRPPLDCTFFFPLYSGYPLAHGHVDFIQLCTRYCLVCHNEIKSKFEALKPYVCDPKLCAYRYYAHNHGPSIEVSPVVLSSSSRTHSASHHPIPYEIRSNPNVVDLLVSLAHVAASDGVLKETLPVGMGLRIPLLKLTAGDGQQARRSRSTRPRNLVEGPDGWVEFDELTLG